MGLTKDIGIFLSEARFDRLPSDATKTIRLGFTDCIAVMVGGWNEPVTRIAASGTGCAVDDRANRPLEGIRAATPELALIYGVAAHALDYDDTALSGHPSAILVPAILAEANALGADGRAMIAAYAAGYEIWADLIRRDDNQHHRKGWHPSAMFGTIAAAGASAVLRNFDAERASRAIGIAASLAGGIVANFGSMTKPYQVGRAAQSGLLAARLAEAGLTASIDAIEDDLGFLRAISPKGAVDTKSPVRLGTDWAILRHGLNIKLYPVCYAAHRALDAIFDIQREHCLAIEEIDAVDLEIGETQSQILRIHRPHNALDAKICGEFAAAAALISGQCGRAELTDDFVQRSDVQKFLPKVRIRTVAERDPEEPAHSPFDRVRLILREGREVTSEPVFKPRGHFKRPAGAEEIWRKFEDCTSGMLEASGSRSLFDSLQDLDRLASVADLGLLPAHRVN